MKIQSLRFKLIWLNGIAIALLLFCAGQIRYRILLHNTHRSFDTTLSNDASFFAANIHPGENGFEWSGNNLNPKQTVIMLGLQNLFFITDLRGQILYEDHYNPFMQRLIRRGGVAGIALNHSGFGEVVGASGDVYRFVSIEMPQGVYSEPAIMHVGRSIKDLKWVMREYEILYLNSVPLILMISAAIGWLLSNRALRPFKDISKAAELISSENLSTRIVTKYKEEEIQTLARSFNAMVGRLNRSFQQMRRFNAEAAHELRTPLSILRGETELLLGSSDYSKEEIKTFLKSNMEELDRLTQIVNDMLTFAEAEDGERVFAKETVNIRATIEDIIEKIRPLASARKIQIRPLNLPDVQIEGDRLLIHRAIFNLMDNAIKYSTDHGAVEVDLVTEQGMMKLRIRDYGIGIAPSDLPNVFNRLFRADSARIRRSGSAGLGLSIVKWIVEAHQGKVLVASDVDRGTEFEVTLPLRSLTGKSPDSRGKPSRHTPKKNPK